MARKSAVDVDGITKAIAKELSLYSDVVKEQIEEIEERVAKMAVKKLRVAGGFENHRSSKGYRKGWRAKKQNRGWVVYNATNYQLTHLLEKGHALRNGGRTVGSAKAFPHIKPVEQNIIKEFEKEIREVLGR